MRRFYSCSLNPSERSRSVRRESCLLCNENVDDEFTMGVFFTTKYRSSEIAAHHHCLLFAAGLPQDGKDSQGFAGFLFRDVQSESERCRRLRCSYCKKCGAASGCGVKSCRQVYHYFCGAASGCVFQFFGGFQSFCPKHRPQQVSLSVQGHVDTTCPICMEETQPQFGHNVLLSPCCGRAYFHRLCIQRQAYAAGYHHFRCGLCNNADQFVEEMLVQGINVPNQDAAWEVEGLFDDLYERYAHCDAETCACSKGRDHQEGRGPWGMIVCSSCGQTGRHIRCLQSDESRRHWECEVCASVEDKQTGLSTTSEQSSPESRPDLPLPETMEIYETNSTAHSMTSLDSFGRRFSSPRDSMFLMDSTDDVVAHDSCSQFDGSANEEPHLGSAESGQDAGEVVTHSGSESEDSIIFVGEVPPPLNALLVRSVRLSRQVDLQAETDSELSDPEPTVYGLTFEQSLRRL